MADHTVFHQLFLSCPVCKNRLDHDGNRALCSQCGNAFYDNPAPCVSILFVNKRNEILLCKRKIEPMKGDWDVIGGFVDAGESIEDTVIREAREEIGAEVMIEAYLGSVADVYDGRPTIASIYLATLKEPSQTLIPQDDVEELQWFAFDTIPQNLAFKGVQTCLEEVQKYLKNKGRL